MTTPPTGDAMAADEAGGAGDASTADTATGETDTADAKPNDRRRGGPIRITLQVVLTVVVTWFIIDRLGVDIARLAALDVGPWNLRWHWLALSIGLLGGAYAASGLLWRGMVQELGGPRLPADLAIRLFLVANLGRYVPGKVLQLAGLTVFASRHGVRPVTAGVAAILGHALSLVGATVVGLAALLSTDSGLRTVGWVGCALVGTTLVVGTLGRSRRALGTLWRRVAGSDQTPPPAALQGSSFVWRWTGLFTLAWVVFGASFWMLSLGLGGPADPLRVGSAFAAAYVGGYLALFAPAGVGVRESLLTAFLAPMMSPERALALALAARVWSTIVEVVPALLMAPKTLREQSSPRAATDVPSQPLQ